MKIRTLLVDDEPHARQRLRLLLADEPDIDIVGECGDGTSAAEAIAREHPDLVFLDVQMPGMDGFEVLKTVPTERMPVVIFTTAHGEHAIRAFEAHALDYLLKPFTTARLKDAVARAREHITTRQAGTAAKGLLDLLGRRTDTPAFLTRLAIKDGDRMVFLKVSDIDSIEAAGKYVVVHLGKENHVLRETLAGLESQLDPEKFLRVSRSAIVNLDQVRELQPMFKGEHVLVLRNGRQLPMTRGLREVEQALKFS